MSTTDATLEVAEAAPIPRAMAAAAPDDTGAAVGRVMSHALAYLVSRALHVVTQLRVADAVGAEGSSVDELARRCGVQPIPLRRLLRTLASHGIFVEDEAGRFHLDAAASLLRADAMRDGVLLCGEVTGDGSWWNAVGDLRHSVTSGEPAFDHRHGMGFFDYMRARPDCAAWFDRGMACFSAAEDAAVAAALDVTGVRHVVDLGGGQGGLLARLLERHPSLRGTLFDLPHVVADPAAWRPAAQAGVARWSVESGDFFERVPAGADAYVLKRILHDWDDDACVRILDACRRAMHAGSRVVVADAVLPAGNAPHPAKVMDVLMMVFGAGRERTAAEFAALFERAGLRQGRIVPTASTLGVVEALPA
jgi:hypothetical protein